MYMMKNLFRVGMGRMAMLFAIVGCLTLTTNQTFAQCDAGTINAPTAAVVCTGVAASTDITTAVGDIPTGAGAGLFGAYVVTISDGGTNTATILFEGMNAAMLLTAADVNAATITVANDGTVTVAGAGPNSNTPVVTGSPLMAGATYNVTGAVFLGTDPQPNGTPIEQDGCATPTTPAPGPAFDLVGNFIDPAGIVPLDDFDCLSPDVASFDLTLNDPPGTANFTVNAQTNVFEDAALTVAAGTGATFPAAAGTVTLFVPANTIFSITIQDANGCEATTGGEFTTPEAELLGLSADYCEIDFAHTIFGDPNGGTFAGPITDPTNPAINDLPAGTFTSVPTGLITDNGDNSASFDPAALGYGQYSVQYEVGDDPDCAAVDQQFVNVYPSFIASFDGGAAANANPLPTVVCQGFNGGSIDIEPDVLDEDIIPILLDVEDVFFITPPPADGDVGAELSQVVTFDGPGITTADPTTGIAQFNTNMAPGTYTITLFVGFEQCLASQSHTITIVDDVNSSLVADYDICGNENGGQIDLTALFTAATTAGGTFTTDFGTVGGDVLSYDPASIPAAGQAVTVTYTVGTLDIDGDGTPDAPAPTDADDDDCYATTTVTLTINDSNPAVFFDLPDFFCGGGTFDLTTYVIGGDADLANGAFFENGAAIADATAWAPTGGNANGIYNIRYEQTNTGDCNNVLMETTDVYFSGDADVNTVLINAGLIIDAADALGICEEATPEFFLEVLAPDYDGNVTAGTFSGPGVLDNGDGTFSLFTNEVSGVVPVQYCIGSFDCEDCTTFSVEVFPTREDATLTPADGTVCSDAGPINLSAYLNAGAAAGTFTADAGTVTATAAGSMLDLTGVADGTVITITYTVVDAQGFVHNLAVAPVADATGACYTGATTTITVNSDVNAAFTTNAEPFVCAGTDITVTAAGPIFGTSAVSFNGNADAGTTLATTGLDGLYEIVHTVTNGECSDVASSFVYIIGTAVATSADGTVCADAGDLINLTQFLGAGTTPGGTFSGTGVAGPGDILIVQDGVDSYDVTYTVGIEGQCDATTTFTVTTVPTPDATLASPSPSEINFCLAEGLTILPNSLVAANTYTVVLNGTTLTIPDGGQGQFQTTEQIDIIDASFDIEDNTGTVVATVLLSTGETITYDGADFTTSDGGSITLGAGEPYELVDADGVTVATFPNADNTYTFSDLETIIIPNPFVVDGTPLQVGLNTITVTVTTPDGCSSTFEQDIFMFNNPVAAFDPAAVTVCTGAGDVDLTQFLSATSTSGGTFTDSDDNVVSGTFDAAAAGAGVYTFTYSVGTDANDPDNDDCNASATLTVTVVASASATLDLPSSLCAGQTIDLADFVDGDATGTFSVDGANIVGSEFTAPDAAGTVTITYTFPTPDNGCGGVVTETLSIVAPLIPALEDNIVCQSQDDYTIDLTQYLEEGPTVNGGTFQFAGIGAQAGNGGAFINEIEYTELASDNTSTGDFIEIAGAEGTDLRDYLVVLYEPNQFTVNDDPQFGETNGRVYAVISPELGFGWKVNYDDPEDGNNQWCTIPDVIATPSCPTGDPDVFIIRSVEEGNAGDWVINGTYSAANGNNYGALAIDLGDEVDDNCDGNSTWEGLKDGPAAIALVYKGGNSTYDAVSGFCANDMTVTQFIGYGGAPAAKAHLTNSNLGIFTATDGPAAGLSSTDINVVDAGDGIYTGKSVQFTNNGWVAPNLTAFDNELNYPVPTGTCINAAADAATAEDQSRGFLNWGQLAPGQVSVSGCDDSSAEENYFDYISPNGDILELDHFHPTLFVGGLVANESDVYTAGTDGDDDTGVLFDFTKNQVLPICFTYQVPSGTPEDLCGDTNVCLYVMMDYEELWTAPSFICEGDGVQNMNNWIDQTVSFVPFTEQYSGSHTFTTSDDAVENIPSLFISEINYFGKDVTSTDEHCVTYNYIDGAFNGGVFNDYNPGEDNQTVKFCDGIEISGLSGTDLSCYQLIFYRPDPTLVATGSNSSSLAYDVVYIDDRGFPVSTDVENLVYMDLYGTIDDDITPNGDSDDIYYGFDGTTVYRLDGSAQSNVPGFGALDLRDPATRSQIEFISAPDEFYTLSNPSDNALANTIPNYNGPCGTPFSPVDINADCAPNFIDPDGVPVTSLTGGIYLDINGNGLTDFGEGDLLLFKDKDGGFDYDPGEQTTGGDGCVTTDDVFPWERDTECENDPTGRLTSGDAFTNRGRSNVGSRWFPILNLDEGVAGVGLFNKCADVGSVTDNFAGETLEFLSWGESLCVQNIADFTEAGPFQQQTSALIDSLDNSFGDLRTLQLVSCDQLPASLTSGCSICDEEGATVWVTVFNGGAIKIASPACDNEAAPTQNQFSNSIGYYNCQLDEDVSEAAPMTLELTINDEDLPDNYIITDFLVQATATGGFVYQWELGDRTGCFYDESDRGCQSSGCGISPGRVNCIPGESALGNVTDLVTGASANGFTLPNALGNRNGPLGCDFAFEGYATKVAERTYYLDIAAAVGQTLSFPVIPSSPDSCYSIAQDGEYSATLTVSINYEQCHYVGDFSSSDSNVNGAIDLNTENQEGVEDNASSMVPVDPYNTLDPTGLQDFSPILVTYDIPNANVGDADEGTDDVSCIDNNTDEDQRDQLINIIYSDPAELVDGALTVCSTAGEVNLVNLLAPGTPASGEFTTDAAAGSLTGNFSFDPAVAGAGTHTVTYTTNFDSACEISDQVTINVVEVALTVPTTVCSTDDAVALTANVDGTFSGAGVVATADGFEFRPSAVGVGTVEITFTTADCSGETDVAVLVNPSPNADFFVPSQACMADGDIVFQLLGDEGGTFAVNGTDIEGNVWTPAASGYVSVTYTVTSANGCTTVEENFTNVFDVFNPTWTHEGGFTVCENDLPLTLTVEQTGGTWTSDINSTVTVEEQEITEDIIDTTFNFIVDDMGNVIDTLIASIDTTVVVIGTVEIVTFDADIEDTDHGAFSVTYEGGGANCGQAQTHVINVYNVPEAPEVTPTVASICDGDDAPVLEMIGNPSYCNCPVTFHVYDGDGNLVYDGETLNEDVFDTGSVIDGPGDYTFSVVTVNKVCESDPVEVNVSVNESPEYSFTVGCTDPATDEAGILITDVTTEGPYRVSINGSEFFAFVPDQTLNVLLGGEINTVVVQDGNGCESAPMEIAVDEAVSFDAVSDCPDADGNSTVTVVPAGGTGPYQVSVNGGAYGDFDQLTVPVDGDAIIRVKDSIGCESESRLVSTSDPVTFTASATCPDENGQSTITVMPINPDDTYVVTVGDIDLDEGVLEFQAGSDVTVVVTSTTTGCASAPFVVEVPAAATLGVTVGCPVVDNITGVSFTTVTFAVDGLSTVFIDGDAIAGTSASLTAGTYEVVAVNADGCESAPQSVEIVDNVVIELNNDASQTIVCGEGDIILAPTGGGEGATYNYYLDAEGTIPASPATGDVYVNGEVTGPRIIYIIATTAGGCESAVLAASTYHYELISVDNVQTTCNDSDGSYTVTFTISGGNGVYTVDGASAPDSYTSAAIPQDQGYSFVIDDSALIPSCEPLTVAGDAPDCTSILVAVDDFGNTLPGEPVTVNILTNDTGCSLSVGGILVSPTCGEIVDIDPDTGNVVYVADADTDCTVDTFVYELIDCNGDVTQATVTIFIEQEAGDLIVQVERDCTNAEETGVYTLNVIVAGGTAPFTISGSINETLEETGVTFAIITDGNPYDITVTDATGAEFFDAGGEVACTKLAVDFIEFYGEVQTEGNFLTWITATEENNDFFTVEHSINGQDFAPIGTVDGAGTTNEAAIYDFLHRNAPSGMSYYRIKAVAFDGEATYTKVISLVRGERVFDIVSVYPIPVSSVVNINFTTTVEGSSTIQIHNVAGKLMTTQDVDTEGGINKVSLNVSSYPVGTYFVTIKNGEEVATTKFVKE